MVVKLDWIVTNDTPRFTPARICMVVKPRANSRKSLACFTPAKICMVVKHISCTHATYRLKYTF